MAQTEKSDVVLATSVNYYGPGATRPDVVAQYQPWPVIAMAAGCYYLVQDGTWQPSGASNVN